MKVLMVCLGNICRSPLAEGILRHLIEKEKLDWEVDSVGTSNWHVGEKPDTRSIEVARKNGIDITNQRARQLDFDDYEKFDLILTMDASNFQNVQNLARKPEHQGKIKMLLNYSYPNENRQVPDPYYDGGFDPVFAMVYDACQNVIAAHR